VKDIDFVVKLCRTASAPDEKRFKSTPGEGSAPGEKKIESAPGEGIDFVVKLCRTASAMASEGFYL
jgi:hypothetical protein